PALAGIKNNLVLEDNLTYDAVLATYPEVIDNGIIAGTFQPYTVVANDHFYAQGGFRNGCAAAKVTFILKYLENGKTTTLATWDKSCNKMVSTFDVGLSTLVGKTVQFILEVDANGSSTGDLSVWINPRIQR
ncbi:MAG: hypothetical protein ACM3PY_16460, partial [Omnitrophica WOR_2 bacterium]